MANFVSPGVYIIEKDVSDYTPSLNPTVVGVVGFAQKGEPNKAVLITSQANLINEFGEPGESLPGQGIEGALEILETCNQLYYIRALDALTGEQAEGSVLAGACPSIGIQASGFGVDSSIYLRVQVTNNEGTAQFSAERSFAIPESITFGSPPTSPITQAQAMAGVIGGSMDDSKLGSYMNASSADSSITSGIGNFIVGNFAGENAQLRVTAYSDAGYSVGVNALFPMDYAGVASGVSATITNEADGGLGGGGFSALSANGVTFNKGEDVDGMGYFVQSIWDGAGYNLSTLPDGTVVGNSVSVEFLGGQNNNFFVNDRGAVLEGFKTSLVGDAAWIEGQINTGAENPTSEVIQGNIYDNGIDADVVPLDTFTDRVGGIGVNLLRATGGNWIGMRSDPGGLTTVVSASSMEGDAPARSNPRYSKLVEGTYSLAGGNNGTGLNVEAEVAALIGVTAPIRTGMQIIDDDALGITLVTLPGITDESVQNSLVTLAENTGDFLAVLGTPLGVGGVQDAIDFHNGLTSYRSSPLNSSYAALYFPQVKVFQSYLAKDIWMDPAIFAVRQMGFTDSVSELWFAPAGYVRGRLTKPVDVEYTINRGDRDSMYSGGNAVNPIVKFPQQGITIWGQRTLQRSPTALDRINVRRLMLFIKATIQASTRRFVFEPNDKITQERITSLLEPFFTDIQNRRGITEFKVICDESVNTPVRVDRNELWCKIMIKPTKSAEILIFELNITNQSAQF